MLFLTYFFAETLFAIILSESKKCLLLLYPPIKSDGQQKIGQNIDFLARVEESISFISCP